MKKIFGWLKVTLNKLFKNWLPTLFKNWFPALIKNILSVTVITYIFIGVIIAVSIYLMNNAYTTAIFKDLVDTLKKTMTLDQDSLLTLERLYELRNELSNIDISKFMYTIFSAVFLTFGVVTINQVTSGVKTINEEVEKSRSELKKSFDDDMIHKSLQQLNTTLASMQTLLDFLRN